MQCFVAIAAAGSMRKAAEVLHIAQSALSRRVLDLEAELGAPLLVRLPRGTALTSAGEAFLRYARDGLLRADQVRGEIDALRGLRAGTVRVAAAEAFMHEVLPSCIAEFRSRYPGVRFEVHAGTTPDVSRLVRDSTVELGLAYNAGAEHDLEVRCTVRDLLIAVVGPGHPIGGRGPISLGDLLGFPLVLPLPTSPTRIRIEQVARAQGISLQPVLESDSVDLRMNLAALGEVVAVIARFAALPWLADGSLVEVGLRGREMKTGRIEVVSQLGRRLSVAAEGFQLVLQKRLNLAPEP